MIDKIVKTIDLEAFSVRLLERVGELVDRRLWLPKERWISSHDVRRLLMISTNTLNDYDDTTDDITHGPTDETTHDIADNTTDTLVEPPYINIINNKNITNNTNSIND